MKQKASKADADAKDSAVGSKLEEGSDQKKEAKAERIE
jgi:hypothetical protein